MKLVFVDSDILHDIILNRSPFYSVSSQILSLPDDSGYKFCTSTHTLLNVHYVTRRNLGMETAKMAVKLLIQKLEIITEDVFIIEKAIDSEFSDFEDAVQFFAAKSIGADLIISRNISDYKHSTIPVLTAEQFLRAL